jgi:hypothetical protein
MAQPTDTIRNRLMDRSGGFALGPAAAPRELLGIG